MIFILYNLFTGDSTCIAVTALPNRPKKWHKFLEDRLVSLGWCHQCYLRPEQRHQKLEEGGDEDHQSQPADEACPGFVEDHGDPEVSQVCGWVKEHGHRGRPDDQHQDRCEAGGES